MKFDLPGLQRDLSQFLEGLGHAPSNGVLLALKMAFESHEGQLREHRDPVAGKLPYIVHPVGVAKVAAEYWHDVTLSDTLEDVLISCLLHDTLEDTHLVSSDLEVAFSSRVANIVVSLSKPQVDAFESRTERNREFVRQILRFGSTACYIKLCDVVHNLGRPATMPTSLLEKTVRRATQDYSGLLDAFESRGLLRARFDEAVRGARAELVLRGDSRGATPASTLEAALDKATAIAKGKVLEEHDIASATALLVGCPDPYIGTAADFINAVLRPLFKVDTRQFDETVVSSLLAGSLEGKAKCFNADRVKEQKIARFLSAPILDAIPNEGSQFVFIALTDASPLWLGVSIFRALIGILAGRHRDNILRNRSVLADEANRLGLRIDSGLAEHARLTLRDLRELRDLTAYATTCQVNLVSALESLIAAHGLEQLVDRLEARVKPANSIARKLVTRHSRSVADLDDILGVRILILSRVGRAAVSAQVLKALRNNSSALCARLGIDQSTVECVEVKSDARYAAQHVRFSMAASDSSGLAVRCELQLRTLHEDAWARASQLLQYKRATHVSQVPDVLQRLAELRAQSDLLLDSISESEKH